MDMEDHHHHQQEQPQQYGMTTDLRQLVNGPPCSALFPTPDLFPAHRNLSPLATSHHHQQQQHFEMMMFGHGLHDFADSAPAAVTGVSSTPAGLSEGAGFSGGDASTGRWPRQETLTLLEIRSRLDPKFKEANQKGPLWDEVSRIMCEEHGYQRSGKKCREKFENLYKYYKKTKEGKAGRHDGKHYRFFRQLEALCGENTTTSNNNNHQTTFLQESNNFVTAYTPSITNQETLISQNNSLSLTNSTDFDTSSSEDDEENERKNKRKSGRRSWKVKIKEFIDSQMRKLVEKQKEWLDKLVHTLEEKEKERMLREEEWRKQETRRFEKEQKFWAKERAWIEARDAALMEALQKLTGKEIQNNNQNHEDEWLDSEVKRLQQLREEILETRFIPPHAEDATWEEVANKMACFGYERSALVCKEKWESIISIKKGKENSGSSNCFDIHQSSSSLFNQGGGGYCDVNDGSSSPSNSNAANVAQGDGCFPFLMMSEGGNLSWENYGLKNINKVNQNH